MLTLSDWAYCRCIILTSDDINTLFILWWWRVSPLFSCGWGQSAVRGQTYSFLCNSKEISFTFLPSYLVCSLRVCWKSLDCRASAWIRCTRHSDESNQQHELNHTNPNKADVSVKFSVSCGDWWRSSCTLTGSLSPPVTLIQIWTSLFTPHTHRGFLSSVTQKHSRSVNMMLPLKEEIQ